MSIANLTDLGALRQSSPQACMNLPSSSKEFAMSKHIMVVDDSKTIRNLVAFVLKNEGFRVSTAEDGMDAMEKLYSLDPVDLIISDVNMPRMDGFTFIKNIRLQDAYKDVPIIVLSTEGQEKDIQTGMSLGANLYMVKPAQPEKMVRNIKMLLG